MDLISFEWECLNIMKKLSRSPRWIWITGLLIAQIGVILVIITAINYPAVTNGSEDGQFYNPLRMAVNGTGYIYVTDGNNDRVQVFTPDGQFVRKWGSHGYGPGQFIAPGGIAVDTAGFVYVKEQQLSRVQVFTATGEFVRQWTMSNNQADDIEINSSGAIFFNRGGIIYSPLGMQIGSLPFWESSALAINGSGYLYFGIANQTHKVIQVWTAAGNFVTQWGEEGTGDGQFSIINAIDIDNTTGRVYVSDYQNHRVQVFTASGQFISSWGSQGFFPGQLASPLDIAVNGETGRVYVIDYQEGRIQAFSNDGQFLFFWGSQRYVYFTIFLIFTIVGAGITSFGFVLEYRQKKGANQQKFGTARVKGETASIPELVTIRRQYEYVGGKVRVKAKVTNSSSAGLLRVRVSLDVPESFRILRVEPLEYAHEGPVVKLNEMLPGDEKAVSWVLEPLICGKEKVHGSVTGTDAHGTPYALTMEPLEVEVRCPLFVQPEEATLPAVQRIFGELPVKSERVYFLPKILAPAEAFNMVKAVISTRDVRFVGIFAAGAGAAFDQTAWFYGATKVGQKRYVLTASVSEQDRAIRIFSACDDEAGCTGFLAEAGAAVRQAIVQRGAASSEETVRELFCEKCGGVLPRGPDAGRDVKCPECGRVWTAADFER